MENVNFEVKDLQAEAGKRINNMLNDKIADKYGKGHVYAFSIQNDVLTIKSTKGTFSAHVKEVKVDYSVANRVPVYEFKSLDGQKAVFNRLFTYLDNEEVAKIEETIKQLPGYKGRNTLDQLSFIGYIAMAIIGIVMWLLCQ